MFETGVLVASSVLVAMSVLAAIGSAMSGLMTIAIDSFIARYGRKLETLPAEIALTSIYLPIFSAVSALIASAGVNLLTDRSRGYADQFLGLATIPLAFATLFLLGMRASRLFLNADGARRLRDALRQVAEIVRDPDSRSSDDLEAAIARLHRIRRIGSVLLHDRATLGILDWMRRKKRQPSATIALNCFLLYGIGLTACGLHAANLDANIRNQRFGWIAGVVLVASLILLNGGILAEWRSYRRRCRSYGAEFLLTSDRLLEKLEAIHALRLVDAPSAARGLAPCAATFSILSKLVRRALRPH